MTEQMGATGEGLCIHCGKPREAHSHLMEACGVETYYEGSLTRYQAAALAQGATGEKGDTMLRTMSPVTERIYKECVGHTFNATRCDEILEEAYAPMKEALKQFMASTLRLQDELAALSQGKGDTMERLREAALAVEQWWVEEGQKHFCGAPVSIFNLRTALATQPTEARPESGALVTAEMVSAALRDCSQEIPERWFAIRDHLNRALAASHPTGEKSDTMTTGIRALSHDDVCQLSRMFNNHGLFSSQITRINEAIKQEIGLALERKSTPVSQGKGDTMDEAQFRANIIQREREDARRLALEQAEEAAIDAFGKIMVMAEPDLVIAVRTAIRALAAAPASPTDREQLADWMIAHSFATGHGDTFTDLLRELEWQVEELRRQK